jgi:hypothetical protein
MGVEEEKKQRKRASCRDKNKKQLHEKQQGMIFGFKLFAD